MIAVFKQKSPGNVAILLIFGLLLKLPLFLNPKPVVAKEIDGRLYQWFIGALPPNSFVLYSLIAFVLLYIQALMLNYLVNQYRMVSRQNYLPGMAYLLITSFLPEWNYLSAPLVANTFIIAVFVYLFSLYNASNSRPQVFNIGLIAGITSYIFFPSTAFVLAVLLGLMILKPFRFNEIFLFLLGWLTLYYFHAAWLFLNDRLSIDNFFPHLAVRVPQFKSSLALAGCVLLLTLPFLVGGYYIQLSMRKMLIQVRKNWSILLFYLLLAFFVPFINSDGTFHTWILVAAPFTAFHAAAYFYPPKSWLPLLLFFLALGFILYQQYGAGAWK